MIPLCNDDVENMVVSEELRNNPEIPMTSPYILFLKQILHIVLILARLKNFCYLRNLLSRKDIDRLIYFQSIL